MSVPTHRDFFVVLMVLLLAPGTSHAQHIPGFFVVAAISPVVVVILAIVLGFLVRSWRTGATHVGLVILWIVLFVITSQLIENDYVIWTPLLLYAVHALIVLTLVVVNVSKRIRARRSGNAANEQR